MSPEFMDAKFWIAVSTLVCAVVIYRKAWPVMMAGLDARIQKIKDRLEKAELMRGEAQHLLGSYQRRYRDAMKEVESVIADASVRAGQLRTEAAEELAEEINRVEQSCQNRMELLEREMMANIRQHVTQEIINRVEAKLGKSQTKMPATEVSPSLFEAVNELSNTHLSLVSSTPAKGN